ncbi:MAG TPA: preprotein translocase subunit SecE [Pirellulales bacterium]|jgi:preprotein translocase subunit SecE|nr:preprotein translocase subunit SecE [Pirellulales bacterium]
MGAFWRDMFSLAVYKRSQGRIARQVTFAVLAAVLVLGAYALWNFLADAGRAWQSSMAGLVAVGGLWVCYRVVNYPRFADFLIAVEAEMNKVSWPSRVELVRSSMVVLITMFGLAATLFAYDLVWRALLTFLRVLEAS